MQWVYKLFAIFILRSCGMNTTSKWKCLDWTVAGKPWMGEGVRVFGNQKSRSLHRIPSRVLVVRQGLSNALSQRGRAGSH